MTPDTGLVNGYKLERHDPAHRIWIGSTYNFCARLLFGIRIRDIDCDYRLIRRSLLEQVHLTSTSGTICVELVRKLELTGCGVVEIGRSSLRAAAREVAVLPAAFAGHDAGMNWSAVGAGGGAAAEGVLTNQFLSRNNPSLTVGAPMASLILQDSNRSRDR